MKRLALFAVAVIFTFSTMAIAADEKASAKPEKAAKASVSELDAVKSGGIKISDEDAAIMKEQQKARQAKRAKAKADKKAKKAKKAAKEAEDAAKKAEEAAPAGK
jgi:hypothetical protein